VMAGYGMVSWFVTGESRSYDRKTGRFARIKDIRHKAGAFELALRYDQMRGAQHLDGLPDLRRGSTAAWTLGANWYLRDNLRFMLNVIESRNRDRLAAVTVDRTRAVTGRLQFDFYAPPPPPIPTRSLQMMLTILGFGMVLTFMYLIMSKRLSPLVALITVPIIFALIGGFGTGLDVMMLDGIKKIAPTGVMLMFAILYFGVMIDAGLFDPLVRIILRIVKGDPLKIVMGTAVLAMLISLDGDGSTTYMITGSAMLPLYRRLGMNALNMTCVTILAGGVMNLTPWGGPTARAATALHVDPADVFVP